MQPIFKRLLGDRVGGGEWTVVGIFDAGGSAFDSEVLDQYHGPRRCLQTPINIFQSATVHLASPDAYQAFEDAITKDPRLNVDVSSEIDYHSTQSETLTRLINVLRSLVAVVMAIGAVFGRIANSLGEELL